MQNMILVFLFMGIFFFTFSVLFYFFLRHEFNRQIKNTVSLKETIQQGALINKKLFDILNERIVLVHKRIDKIFVIEQDVPAPNEATKKTDELEDLDENSLYGISEGVKFQVEGGDTNVPPEYPAK